MSSTLYIDELKSLLNTSFTLVKLEGLLAIIDKPQVIFRRVPNSFLDKKAARILIKNGVALYTEKDSHESTPYAILLNRSEQDVVRINNYKNTIY